MIPSQNVMISLPLAGVVLENKSPTYEPSSCELSKMQTCMYTQVLYWTTVLFKVLYCKIKMSYFFVCNVLLFVKSIINIVLQYYTTNYVS